MSKVHKLLVNPLPLLITGLLFSCEMFAFPAPVERVITFFPAVEVESVIPESKSQCDNECIGFLYDENRVITDARCAHELSDRENETQIVDQNGQLIGIVAPTTRLQADQGIVSVSTGVGLNLSPVESGENTVDSGLVNVGGYCLSGSAIKNISVPIDLGFAEKNDIFSNIDPVIYLLESKDTRDMSPGSPIFLGGRFLCVLSDGLCLRPQSKVKRHVNFSKERNLASKLAKEICDDAESIGWDLRPPVEEFPTTSSGNPVNPSYSRADVICMRAKQGKPTDYSRLKVAFDYQHGKKQRGLSVQLTCGLTRGHCINGPLPLIARSAVTYDIDGDKKGISNHFSMTLKALFRLAEVQNADEVLKECSGFSFSRLDDDDDGSSLAILDNCIVNQTTEPPTEPLSH